MGTSDFVVKLDRSVGNLAQYLTWVSEVRVVLWNRAIKHVESEANSG